VLLAAIGLTVGTLFSAMAVNTRLAELLLAFDIVFVAACTLAYPFTVED